MTSQLHTASFSQLSFHQALNTMVDQPLHGNFNGQNNEMMVCKHQQLPGFRSGQKTTSRMECSAEEISCTSVAWSLGFREPLMVVTQEKAAHPAPPYPPPMYKVLLYALDPLPQATHPGNPTFILNSLFIPQSLWQDETRGRGKDRAARPLVARLFPPFPGVTRLVIGP